MKQIPMTVRGAELLRQELDFLKNERRPEIIKAIAEAREHGDLKENAEYHAAKERLAFIDGRIGELSDLVSRAHVIDPSSYEHDKVRFGSTIMLENLETNEEVTYTIVGSTESNPDRGLISYYSPLAIQLMGKSEGEEVTIKLPSGQQEYEILEIAYHEINFEG